MDLDYALRTDEPLAITDKSTVEEKANYEKWERSNRMCLMVMKHTIPITIRGFMPDKVSAKSFSAELATGLLNRIKSRSTCILVS